MLSHRTVVSVCCQWLHPVLVVAMAAAPIAAADRPVVESVDPVDWIKEYNADLNSLRSFYSLTTSPARFDRLERFQRAWLARFETLIFARLPVEQQVDALLLRQEIEASLRSLRRERERQSELTELLPFAALINELEARRWSGLRPDPEATATLLAAADESLRTLRGRLESARDVASQDEPAKLRVTPTRAARAARLTRDLRQSLATWYDDQSVYVPEFLWWMQKPYASLAKTLQDYAEFLQKQIAQGGKDEAMIGDPIGRAALLEELEREWISYTPEELLAIAEVELAWCTARQIECSQALGFGTDWQAALRHVKEQHVEPGEQMELVFQQARDAIEFLDQRQLVTIPELCRETWRGDMLTADGQRTLPYAAYGGQTMLVAYPTVDMAHDSKLMSMRGNNIHFSRIVTPHELIPGHHLQGFIAQRSNTHRRLFSTPFLVEGWALYWEMLLWDLGYARGPADQMGMLFWRKHRCARIIVSLEFHLEIRTPAEMIDYLVTRVGHERDGATSEVRRYIGDAYGPLYQCAYLIGGLELMALRRELVDTGRMTNREFHDAVLAENSIPIELIRARLTRQELTSGTRSAWRFYGDPPLPRSERF
ncbi:MAG: DUF885 family protein [Planctomycetota bacterium]